MTALYSKQAEMVCCLMILLVVDSGIRRANNGGDMFRFLTYNYVVVLVS